MKFLFLLALPLAAQSLTVTADRTTLTPGETVNVSINLTGALPGMVATFQMNDETLPAGRLTLGQLTAVGAAQAATKTTASSATVPRLSVVYGRNTPAAPTASQNTIQAGQVLTLALTAPANAAPGEVTYRITNTIWSSPNGTALPLGSPADLKFTISTNFDLDKDGDVDLGDVDVFLDQALGRQPKTSCDFNGDQVCNVRDLQLISNAVKP